MIVPFQIRTILYDYDWAIAVVYGDSVLLAGVLVGTMVCRLTVAL